MSNDDGGGGEHDALKATTTEKKNKKQRTGERVSGCIGKIHTMRSGLLNAQPVPALAAEL